MELAHTQDPGELPRALRHVHALHRKAAGRAPGSDGRWELRAGAAAVIFGDAIHSVGAQVQGAGERRGVRTAVPGGPAHGGPGPLPAPASEARLSCGFRGIRLVPHDGGEMAPLLASTRHNILPFMVNQRQVGVYSATFAVEAGTLDDPDPRRFVDGVMSEVWLLEDSRCMEQLERLPPHGEPPGRLEGAEDVAGFVRGLNARGGRKEPLDTVFVNPSLTGSPGGGRGALRVLDADGARIVPSGRVPEGTMYVTSSRLGPIFVSGPTVVHSGDGGLVVARYCAAYESADNPPRPDRGLAVRVGQ